MGFVFGATFAVFAVNAGAQRFWLTAMLSLILGALLSRWCPFRRSGTLYSASMSGIMLLSGAVTLRRHLLRPPSPVEDS
jgi:hypothetical protein